MSLFAAALTRITRLAHRPAPIVATANLVGEIQRAWSSALPRRPVPDEPTSSRSPGLNCLHVERAARPTETTPMRYLSDVNLRAVLNVLIGRAGGTVEISNEELYDAMLPDHSHGERVLIEETETGLRLSIVARP
ncbi:hypothetical protein ACGFIY_29965 [Micromonospora chersina]|uniref:hypothetical protein n=2 Tax=Micromonosporaceae TaxID=28056 RepID=UPI00371217B9